MHAAVDQEDTGAGGGVSSSAAAMQQQVQSGAWHATALQRTLCTASPHLKLLCKDVSQRVHFHNTPPKLSQPPLVALERVAPEFAQFIATAPQRKPVCPKGHRLRHHGWQQRNGEFSTARACITTCCSRCATQRSALQCCMMQCDAGSGGGGEGAKARALSSRPGGTNSPVSCATTSSASSANRSVLASASTTTHGVGASSLLDTIASVWPRPSASSWRRPACSASITRLLVTSLSLKRPLTKPRSTGAAGEELSTARRAAGNPVHHVPKPAASSRSQPRRPRRSSQKRRTIDSTLVR